MLGADQGLGGMSIGIHRGRMAAAFCSATISSDMCCACQYPNIYKEPQASTCASRTVRVKRRGWGQVGAMGEERTQKKRVRCSLRKKMGWERRWRTTGAEDGGLQPGNMRVLAEQDGPQCTAKVLCPVRGQQACQAPHPEQYVSACPSKHVLACPISLSQQV